LYVCARGLGDEWSGEVMVCGAVQEVLKQDQKWFLMFLEHEQRASESRARRTCGRKDSATCVNFTSARAWRPIGGKQAFAIVGPSLRGQT
jgi:hypothetical protein